MKKLTRKQRKQLCRIVIAALLTATLTALAHIFSFSPVVTLLATLPIYCFIGYDVLWAAVRDVGNGQVFGEKFLMAIATVVSPLKGTRPVSISNMVIPKE